MRVENEQLISPQHASWPLPQQFVAPVNTAAADNSARLDLVALESLVLNLDASLRVHARHHFFSWTQGTLQSLVRHELLVCALRDGDQTLCHVDSFSMVPVEPARFNELFRQDVVLVPHLIKAWEKNRRRPVVCEAAGDAEFRGSTFARELRRIGATSIVAHGTYGAGGKLSSFFIFACQPGAISPQTYLIELLVPFLHPAWVRTRIDWSADGTAAKPAATSLLTSRELEVLEWIYRGKSNIEIGMILAISSLTVKNHVQKILRKLDVLNRTQAVGKALALRILNA